MVASLRSGLEAERESAKQIFEVLENRKERCRARLLILFFVTSSIHVANAHAFPARAIEAIVDGAAAAERTKSEM